jgi:hypothetical protein
VPASVVQQFDVSDGLRLLIVASDAELVHDEHCTVPVPAGAYLVSHKRRYDRDNGWAAVED